MTLLGNISEVKGGKRLPKGKVVQDSPTEYRYIRVTNFNKDSVDVAAIKYIDAEAYSKVSRYTISDKDIYISIAGTIGLVGIVPNELSGAILTENAAKICNVHSTYSPRYIMYYLRSRIGQSEINARVVGTSQPKLALFRIKDIPVPKVSLDEQLKIVVTLSNFDDLIENNSKRMVILEQMARTLYRQYSDDKISNLWRTVELGDCLIVRRGKAYKSSELSEEGGLPFVNLKCVNRGGGFRKDGLKHFTGAYKSTHQVSKGDIVVAVTDMTQGRLIVARPARVPSLEGGFGIVSMDLVKIEPKVGYDKDYIYALLRWSSFADEVKNHANGANVLHLNPDRITSYKMRVAPINVQKEYSKKVGPIFNLIDNLQLKNEALVSARELLLPRLMTGEIKV